MRLYNTLTREKKEIQPLEPGHFKIYSCGPTVYRFIHIGNLRTFCAADWLRRALMHQGYSVTHVKNITDVGHMRVELLDQGEDKLIAQARKEGKTSAEIAVFYTEAFLTDEAKLNILPAQVFPRATQHIPEMLEIVQNLVGKGIAYEVEGDVFFDIKAFPGYGKLSGNLLEGLMEGARDTVDTRRRNPEDFPLWKKAEPGREMTWDSPWGRGFPGWHIECSAMSIKYLGRQFDIHTGGVDNIFPHHEDELAQSESFTGQPFVNCWMHAQHLLADGLKMAKSTGNAYTLAEVEALGFEPLALRYFYTTAHYRSRINFTFTALRAAQISLQRLRNRLVNLSEQVDQDEDAKPPERHEHEVSQWQTIFWEAIEDDLNLPRAMATLWQMLRQPDELLSPAAKLQLFLDWDKAVLGFGLEAYLQSRAWLSQTDSKVCLSTVKPEIRGAVRERESFRKARDYRTADIVRRRLARQGYTVRDSGRGPVVLPRNPVEDFQAISASAAGPKYGLDQPDLYEFSVGLLAQNSRSDLERCLQSVLKHSYGRKLELVIIDNGSTDDTLPYLRGLAANGLRDKDFGLQVIFADHNLGFAAGRNVTTQASRGRFVVMLDTSIELNGDIWTELERTLSDPAVGLAGPYGLVTTDLREFEEATGPAFASDSGPDEPSPTLEVDAIEGYLFAFRRELWSQVGPIDEKFRFYRLMDIYLSFFFKTAGLRVVATPGVAQNLIKHPHLEWYSLSEEEQRTRSKKNFDLLRARWHHAQSMLVANFKPQNRWGHDAVGHLAGQHTHTPDDLPSPGEPHVHSHQHWPDHDHNHVHYHNSTGKNERNERGES